MVSGGGVRAVGRSILHIHGRYTLLLIRFFTGVLIRSSVDLSLQFIDDFTITSTVLVFDRGV